MSCLSSLTVDNLVKEDKSKWQLFADDCKKCARRWDTDTHTPLIGLSVKDGVPCDDCNLCWQMVKGRGGQECKKGES